MKTQTKKKQRAKSKPNREPSKIDALLKARLFLNAEAAQQQVRALWLAVKSEFRLEAAMELFRLEEVSLERAAEIAGLNRWVFDAIRIKRGIKIVIEVPPVDELEKAVEAIRKHAQ